jgi:hypothetical protein
LNNFSQGGSSNCVVEVDGGDECNKRKEELREESFGRSLVGLDSGVHKLAKETLENNRGVDLSHPSQRHSCADETCRFGDGDGIEVSQSGDSLSSYDAMAKEMSDNHERVQVDSFVKEKLQNPELIDSTLKGGLLDDDLGKFQGIIPLIRKRKLVEMDVDAYAIIASKDTCIPIANAFSSSPPACERNDLVKTCGRCFKRQRYL